MHPFLRASKQNIQASPTHVGVDWAKTLVHFAAWFLGTVGHGDKDDVAFITLHIFEIFDEQRFASRRV